MNASVLGTNSSAAGYGYGYGEQEDGHDPSSALQSCIPGSGWMDNPCGDYSVPILLLAIVAVGAVAYVASPLSPLLLLTMGVRAAALNRRADATVELCA